MHIWKSETVNKWFLYYYKESRHGFLTSSQLQYMENANTSIFGLESHQWLSAQMFGSMGWERA